MFYLHLSQVARAAYIVECVGVEPTINAAIIHHNYDNWQAIAVHCFDFHGRKAKGGITFNADNPFARMIVAAIKSGCYGEARTHLTHPNRGKNKIESFT